MVVEGDVPTEYNEEQRLSILQNLLDAEKEAKTIGNRVKESIRFRRERGDDIGRASYGQMRSRKYEENENGEKKLVSSKLVKNPAEVKIIQKIKSLFDSGYNPRRISEKLEEDGIAYRRGLKWTIPRVRYILGRK